MSVWKQVGQTLSGLAKHVVKSVASEPMEVVKDAVGQQMEQGQQTQQNTSDPNQSNPVSDLAKAGFQTQSDYTKYQQLSGNRDQMELAILRKRLHQQQGLDVSIEGGMERARQEYEQKEQQRKQVEEQKKEEKKQMDLQVKKKEEDLALKAAKQASSAENKAWGAG